MGGLENIDIRETTMNTKNKSYWIVGIIILVLILIFAFDGKEKT